VRAALNATKGHESIVGEVSFDVHGQNSVALITKYVIQDGKWTVWEDSEYAAGQRKLKGL
jgi:branched-chain amino acid transport system substrate-binding protein